MSHNVNKLYGSLPWSPHFHDSLLALVSFHSHSTSYIWNVFFFKEHSELLKPDVAIQANRLYSELIYFYLSAYMCLADKIIGCGLTFISPLWERVAQGGPTATLIMFRLPQWLQIGALDSLPLSRFQNCNHVYIIYFQKCPSPTIRA